jgi:aconitase A
MAEIIDESSSIESTTVGVYRTSSTVAGGRRFSFSAMVVVGDRQKIEASLKELGFGEIKLLDIDGKVKPGSLARIEPEGKVTRMWEAIETYMARKQPLIIIAGADYGQGSSRDWAAKGVRLAGVEAIVAEGFERIHRTNLVGMGVLPLEFKPGVNRRTLGIDGTETFDVLGDRRPRTDLTLVIRRSNGERVEVPVTCRLDTAEEVSIYDAGGVCASPTRR